MFKGTLTAATGAKNQRHESHTDEDVYLYCACVQRKNKLTFSNYTFSNLKILFALLVTHKEKRQSRMPVILKKPNSHQPVFRPEVPPTPSTQKRPVQEAKFNLKNSTGWNANSYIYRYYGLSTNQFSQYISFKKYG